MYDDMQNHNILIFASLYSSNTSANGICARNIAVEFKKKGHNVFVVALSGDSSDYKRVVDGIDVWFIREEWHTRLLRFFQKQGNTCYWKIIKKVYSFTRAIMISAFYPNDSRYRVKKMVSLAKKIINNENVDILLGTCMPYSGIAAAVALKRLYKDKLFVETFHFDLLATPNNSVALVRNYKIFRIRRAFERELSVVDRVVLPESAKVKAQNDKIIISGFPVIVDDPIELDCDCRFPTDIYNITYVGSIDGRNRSIRDAIILIRNINKTSSQFRLLLHIWGYISDTSVIEEIKKSPDCVVYYGLLDSNKVQSVYRKSDFLLNISNKLLYDLIPSKIFQMFKSEKPIINIVYNKLDCTIPFFEKYGRFCRVNAYESLTLTDNELQSLLHSHATSSCFSEYYVTTVANRLLHIDVK